MKALLSSDKVGIEIIKALGLPEEITRLELIFAPRQPIVVKCEIGMLVSDHDVEHIVSMFAEYELRKVERLDGQANLEESP